MSKYLLGIIFLSFTLMSCVDKQREEELAKREEAMALKEKQFEDRLEEYKSLKKFRDSIELAKNQIKDTVRVMVIPTWPDSLAGRWEVKTVCTESDCSKYNIGDRQTSIFEFADAPSGLSAKEYTNKEQLLRSYSVVLDNNKIKLKNISDSLNLNPATYEVNIEHHKKNNLTGHRTVSIEDCNAYFSLDLSRQKN